MQTIGFATYLLAFAVEVKLLSLRRGEERFREEGETAKKDREEGERKRKK